MLGEIPYMIVWGFFSAMGWMTANWTVDKYWPDKDKDKEKVQVVQQQESKQDKNTSKDNNKEN
jgi:hypothetical protein